MRFVFSITVIAALIGGFLFWPAASAVATHVQSVGTTANGAGSTIAKAFVSANTAGNLIVAAVTWDASSSGGSLTCSDSQGNTYATATTQWDGPNTQWLGVCYAPNVKAGANTVTASFGANRQFRHMTISEYSGVAKTAPVDVVAKQAAAGSTGSNAITSTAAVTTVGGDLIFGAVMDTTSATSITAGTGFTQRAFTANKSLAVQDMTQANAGSVASTQTFGAAHRYDAIMVAFKPLVAAPDTTAPTAPAGLTAIAASSTQINLSWTAATDNVGVTGYRLERCAGTGCTTFVEIASPTMTSYVDTGLTASTLYRYQVRAIDAAGNLGSYSTIAQATTMGLPDTTAPSAPTDVSGAGVSISQINLTWTASTDNVAVTGYKVFRNGTQVGTSVTASFQDTALAVGTAYTYSISAYDAVGNTSDQSTSATASTLADTSAPTKPTGLTANPSSTTQINLSWTASTDNVGVTGYRVYRDGGLVTTVTATNYSDTGLTAGTTYSYAVDAIDAAGNASAQTNAVTATTPTPDIVPPTAVMTAPTSGSTVNGTITVSANATDNVGVQSVEFLLDGVTINTDTAAPYSYSWNTTTTSNGSHTLSARARDAAGNFGITSGVVTVQVNNPTGPQLPPDLMAGWPFTEFTGTTTEDVTIYHNTASFTTINNPVWASGKNGGGIRFDGGTSDYLTVQDSAGLDISGTAITLSMWINPAGGTTGDQVPFGKFWSGSGGPYYQYGLELDRGTTPHFWIGTTAGTAVGAAMGSALPVGQWSHLAIVYDGARVSFYLNGNLMSTPAMTGSIASRAGSAIRIGNDINGATQGFRGSLDELRIYKRVQTQADVQADMNTPLIGTGMGNGPSVVISDPAQNAQVSGVTTVTADASDATAVQFYVDGTAIGAEDTVEPFVVNWDTRASSSGAHTLTARARNDVGTTVSSPITVNVVNTDTFQNEVLATGLYLPTAMKFLPDGRMLVSELTGKIKIIPAPYITPDPTPFLTLTNIGTSPSSQEGIFDFALDPNFATNHYFYVFYTANDLRDRLSRFTANAGMTGTVAGSELVLYRDPIDLQSDEHHGGAIAFSNDNHIFFTTGEHFQGAPAQDLNSPFGKIHRINMDGTVPTDNPFYDGAGPHWDSVWALGLRNPYRAYFDNATGRLYVGDVGGNGGNAYEEVDLGVAGANYGWPNCEFGNCGNPAYTPALYAYSHNGRDGSVTGGFVYHGSQFPTGMQGSYFFGDYAQNWIKRMTFNADGTVSGVFNFEPMSGVVDGPYGDIVYLTEGPDGCLYYIDLGYSDVSGTFGVSRIHRIRYQSSNQAPSSVASADVTAGPVGATITFSSAGSTDPESQPLTYSWDFGDGSPLSTQANPSHVYTAAGNYSVRLTVSDGVNNTFSPPLSITIGSAPTATILTPTDGLTFRAGDVISYSGDATDPDDGSLPASAYSWTVDFLHDTHVHPGATTTGVKNGTFTIPSSGHDFSGNTRYRITLTVTDSSGLTSTKVVTVWPQKVNLTFDTLPSGQTLYLDTVAKSTPFVYDTLVGFNHTIEARDAVSGTNSYTFASWSDGGAQTHGLVVPATNASYTATYTVGSTVPASAPAAAWGFNEASGTTATDASGNANTVTLIGGLARVASTAGHGSALSFSGSGQYLTAPNSTSLDIAGQALTLSMWVNPSTTSSGDQVVIGKHWNTTMTSPYYQYGIEFQSNGSRPVFQIGTTGGTMQAAMSTTLTKGTWSHLAIVWNGTTAQFYVNGTLVQTSNLTATITARGNPLRLGADAGTQQFYKGLLDDVRIYKKVQTQAEIQADMTASL